MTMYPETDTYFACSHEGCPTLHQAQGKMAKGFEPICTEHRDEPMTELTHAEFLERVHPPAPVDEPEEG